MHTNKPNEHLIIHRRLLQFTGTFLFFISSSAFCASWETSFNTEEKEIGNISGRPVLLCTYRVGAGSDYFIKVKISDFSCPPIIYYNVERDKWARFPPVGS